MCLEVFILYIYFSDVCDRALMEVFHWGQLVSNYGLFEGREHCLQCQLGSVVVSQLVMDQHNIKHIFTHLPQFCVLAMALPTW